MAFWKRHGKLTSGEQAHLDEFLRRCALMNRKHVEQLCEEGGLTRSLADLIVQANPQFISPLPPTAHIEPLLPVEEPAGVTAGLAASTMVDAIRGHFDGGGVLDDALSLPVSPLPRDDDRDALIADLTVAASMVRNQALRYLVARNLADGIEKECICALTDEFAAEAATLYFDLATIWSLSAARHVLPTSTVAAILVERSCARRHTEHRESPMQEILLADLFVEAEWRWWKRVLCAYTIQPVDVPNHA